jgi:hypothetical protein
MNGLTLYRQLPDDARETFHFSIFFRRLASALDQLDQRGEILPAPQLVGKPTRKYILMLRIPRRRHGSLRRESSSSLTGLLTHPP